ncbi:galanin receptor type 1-like [Diadema antillarum]|uniref:galanin receptor type 1-like n=1 Tax=Diadema antillarum TaxID=105358 RepID=UPI003A8A9EBC
MILRVSYSLIGAVGMLGNGLVLFVIYRVPSLRNITNLFIFNQSLIDFVSSVFLCVCFLTPVIPLPSDATLAAIFCAIWSSRYIYWGAHKASTTNLLVLTLERYVAIVHPIYYRRHIRRRRAVMVAILVWVIGYAFQLFWAAVQRVVGGVCLIDWPNKEAKMAFGLLLFFTQIVIPVSIMIFIYVSIYMVLNGRISTVSVEEDEPSRQQGQDGGSQPSRPAPAGLRNVLPNYRAAARNNVLKTLLIICIVYVVCWAPNMTIFVYYSVGGKVDFSGWQYLSAVCLAFGNMVLNPFIYTFKYDKFKKALGKVFRGNSRKGMSDESNVSDKPWSTNT